MTQIPEQLIDQHNNPMMQQMNPNINLITPVNIPQIIPPQPNMPINGNIPLNMGMPMPNNQTNTDTSNIFFY